MATLPIAISQPAIDDFCERHPIRKLSLFGSHQLLCACEALKVVGRELSSS